MAGYLAKSGSDTTGLSYDAMLFCKTNIAGYFFDGFMRVSHERKLTITQNPVETGAAIVDHAYVNPSSVTMKIMMSDVHQSIIPGQFSDLTFRHTSAWAVLKQIQESRIPVDIFTKLGYYKNMLIEEISADDTKETFRALSATVKLTEIPVARVKTVKISKASQTTIDTKMAEVQVDYVDRSGLSWITGQMVYKN
nr:MAG TPA: hypothetical protein [Caudoviricetes sp.]